MEDIGPSEAIELQNLRDEVERLKDELASAELDIQDLENYLADLLTSK